MTPDVDVAVVGAGPAGVAASLALRQARPGLKVALLDAAVFPREKPCGGAISRRGLTVAASLGVPLRASSVNLASAALRDGKREATVGLSSESVGVVVRRLEFDALLVGAARSRGVDLQEGVRVKAVAPFHDDRRRLTTSGGDLIARRVIGADGATSICARVVSRERGGPRPAFAMAIEVVTPPGNDDPPAECMRYVFGPSGGYAWDFPAPPPAAEGLPRGLSWNRGIYRVRDTRGLRPRLKAFLAGQGAHAEKAAAWPERLYDPARPISTAGLFLAGEAIGVNPATGEGIAPALESGTFAAAAVIASLERGPRGDDDHYRRSFRQSILGSRLALGARLCSLLYGRRASFWRGVALADRVSQRLFLADFAGEIDLPARKATLLRRFAVDMLSVLWRGTAPPGAGREPV